MSLKLILMHMRRGITIIELVVVLAVISTISAIGFRSFVSVERRMLQQAAEILQNDLHEIRQASMIQDREYMLGFSGDSRAYTIRYYDPDWREFVTVRRVEFPHNIRFHSMSTSDRELHYTSIGTSPQANGIILVSENYNIALTIALGSGRVAIKELRPIENIYTPNDLD